MVSHNNCTDIFSRLVNNTYSNSDWNGIKVSAQEK